MPFTYEVYWTDDLCPVSSETTVRTWTATILPYRGTVKNTFDVYRPKAARKCGATCTGCISKWAFTVVSNGDDKI